MTYEQNLAVRGATVRSSNGLEHGMRWSSRRKSFQPSPAPPPGVWLVTDPAGIGNLRICEQHQPRNSMAYAARLTEDPVSWHTASISAEGVRYSRGIQIGDRCPLAASSTEYRDSTARRTGHPGQIDHHVR